MVKLRLRLRVRRPTIAPAGGCYRAIVRPKVCGLGAGPLGFDAEAVARNRILFHLLTEASPEARKDWRNAFEVKFKLADPRPETREPAVPKEAVRGITRELLRAINFHHAGAIAFDPETMEARPIAGEPSAYAHFDGYTLTIGSTGYAAW